MAMSPRLLRPRATFGFDPTTVAGLEGWWDAADASSVTLDSGRVSTWNDKSGKGRNATNSTSGSTQPDYVTGARNGRNVVRFAGASSQFLQAGSVGNWNFLHNGTNSFVIGVIRCFDSSDPNSGGSIISTGGGSSVQIGCDILFDDRASVPRNNAFGIALARGVSGQFTVNDVTVDTLTPSTYVTFETLLDGDNATAANRSRSRINGGPQFGSNAATNAPSASNSSYTLAFGRGQFATPAFFFTGDFCEILMYSQHPTAAQIASIQGYLAWKWGLQAQLPYNHPYAKAFPGFGSQTTPTDPDALAYLSSVATADGAGMEVGAANAINDFIVGCKADGIWTAIKASCILMGARTLSGALTPLVGAAPTNNGPFVSGDYNRKTGLVGNGTSKYLDSNRNNNADPQDSKHLAVYASSTGTASGVRGFIAGGIGSATGPSQLTNLHATTQRSARANDLAGVLAGVFNAAGFWGVSRASSSATTERLAGSNTTITAASGTRENSSLIVFARNTLTSGVDGHTDARLAFYSIGESLTLSSLDSRVSTLYNAIGAAIP